MRDKSRFGAQATRKRQTAAGIRWQVSKHAEASLVPGGRVDPAVRPSVHTEAVMVRISKTIVAGISALAMAAAVVLPTTPASAGGWRGAAAVGTRRRLAWRRLAWRRLAWRRLAWRRLGGSWRLAWRLLARRLLEQRLVGPGGRRRRDRRRGDRQLPLLGRRLWVWRRLLAGSADLRRLRQLPRRPVRERLLTFTALDRTSIRASRKRGPFHLAPARRRRRSSASARRSWSERRSAGRAASATRR